MIGSPVGLKDGAGYLATSSTSNAIANSGSKTFTVAAGLAYAVGSRVRFISAGSGAWMEGVIASYSGTSMSVTMDLKSGSGTYTDWSLSIAGQPGQDGAGSGTVTSVGLTEGVGIDITGSSPITTSGSFAVSLANPTLTTNGGVKSITAVAGKFIAEIDSNGTPVLAAVDFTEMTGSVDPSQLPFPSVSTLGGVQAVAAVSHQFVTSITALGVPVLAQPAFSDISGTVASSQLPNPSAGALGGVKSIAPVSHNFVTSIGTNGSPNLAQPSASDISGLGTMATQNASSVAISGGTITGLGTPSNNSDAATKSYVDNAVIGLWDWKGPTDCSANPNYPSALKGDAYVVSVAGKIGGASGISVDVGDVFVAAADNAGGTQASVGSSWTIMEHNLQGALLAGNNLSDVGNAATARSNLGLVIGTNVQAYSAELAGLAGMSSSAFVCRTGSGTYANRTITGTTNVITVTNGNGVSGDPTITVGNLVQRTDTAAVLTAQQNFGSASITSSSNSIAWNLATAQVAKHTFTENTTLANPTNMVDGGIYTIKFTQHASSPKTLAFGTAYKWPGGSAPTISSTNGAVDILTFVSDGTYMYGTILKAFA